MMMMMTTRSVLHLSHYYTVTCCIANVANITDASSSTIQYNTMRVFSAPIHETGPGGITIVIECV